MEELERYCEMYELDYVLIESLLYNFLEKGWDELEAIEHIKDLIVEGDLWY